VFSFGGQVHTPQWKVFTSLCFVFETSFAWLEVLNFKCTTAACSYLRKGHKVAHYSLLRQDTSHDLQQANSRGRSFHFGIPRLEERKVFNCFFEASIKARVTVRDELLVGK
jgi:hypothetical protein